MFCPPDPPLRRLDHLSKEWERRFGPAPSGIAQLRAAAAPDTAPTPPDDDYMNLDDFLVSSYIGTPAPASPSATATAAIPIKPVPRFADVADVHPARASAPTRPPLHDAYSREFGYVPRHVRKTSVDERVRRPPACALAAC